MTAYLQEKPSKRPLTRAENAEADLLGGLVISIWTCVGIWVILLPRGWLLAWLAVAWLVLGCVLFFRAVPNYVRWQSDRRQAKQST